MTSVKQITRHPQRLSVKRVLTAQAGPRPHQVSQLTPVIQIMPSSSSASLAYTPHCPARSAGPCYRPLYQSPLQTAPSITATDHSLPITATYHSTNHRYRPLYQSPLQTTLYQSPIQTTLLPYHRYRPLSTNHRYRPLSTNPRYRPHSANHRYRPLFANHRYRPLSTNHRYRPLYQSPLKTTLYQLTERCLSKVTAPWSINKELRNYV